MVNGLTEQPLSKFSNFPPDTKYGDLKAEH